jgi:hypothetical protein
MSPRFVPVIVTLAVNLNWCQTFTGAVTLRDGGARDTVMFVIPTFSNSIDCDVAGAEVGALVGGSSARVMAGESGGQESGWPTATTSYCTSASPALL